MWVDKGGMMATDGAEGNTKMMASAEDQAKFAEIAAKITEKGKGEVNALGVDADKAIMMIKEEMAK